MPFVPRNNNVGDDGGGDDGDDRARGGDGDCSFRRLIW